MTVRRSEPIDPEVVLAEAEMVVALGHLILDHHLERRLEQIARDVKLPSRTRARAISLLCRLR